MEDMAPDSLAFVQLLRPVPDLVVIGTGASAKPVPRESLQALRQMGISMESLTTVLSS